MSLVGGSTDLRAAFNVWQKAVARVIEAHRLFAAAAKALKSPTRTNILLTDVLASIIRAPLPYEHAADRGRRTRRTIEGSADHRVYNVRSPARAPMFAMRRKRRPVCRLLSGAMCQ
jgi:hypothetical protein